ncbi:hypothetical protein [uncultured Sphingorhabdus sp.]|uniref:hypothetical protein n=1 Tax=uncultured Sphingorhabdus sp. TaxID=1686106 RepID=UPI00260CE181|nr:hypothetical protein [uncultured Sphingorhabdus sp.]HMS19541.1 hypothetical protein [Sphingorhabdus sp.]
MVDRAELIAAYLDGSLDGEALVAFEAEMRADSALAADVQRWRSNDSLLHTAFPLDSNGINPAMLEKLGLGEPVPHGTPIPLAANDNRWSWGRYGIAGSAIAASIAVALILFQPDDQDVAGDRQFQIAMETLPSGQTLNLREKGEVGPVLSFRAGDGRYCREFSGEQIGGGIACRSSDGWTVEAQTVRGPEISTNGEIRTAAGNDPKSLNAEMDRLNASDPLDKEKENKAISSGWKN